MKNLLKLGCFFSASNDLFVYKLQTASLKKVNDVTVCRMIVGHAHDSRGRTHVHMYLCVHATTLWWVFRMPFHHQRTKMNLAQFFNIKNTTEQQKNVWILRCEQFHEPFFFFFADFVFHSKIVRWRWFCQSNQQKLGFSKFVLVLTLSDYFVFL